MRLSNGNYLRHEGYDLVISRWLFGPRFAQKSTNFWQKNIFFSVKLNPYPPPWGGGGVGDPLYLSLITGNPKYLSPMATVPVADFGFRLRNFHFTTKMLPVSTFMLPIWKMSLFWSETIYCPKGVFV